MRLDRAHNPDGRGKYGIIKLRRQENPIPPELYEMAQKLKDAGYIDVGTDPETEFFVIMLRDKYAGPAIRAYANAAWADGEKEYASDLHDLARKAEAHPNRKKPD